MKPCRFLPGALLLTALGMVLAGCPVVGWMATAFAPPKKVKAVFDLPPKKAILVFVDDYYHVTEFEAIKMDLAREINKGLIRNKLAARTIDYDRVLDLQGNMPYFRRLKVSEIGQRLGADLVLYIVIDRFSLHDNDTSLLWRGKLQVSVRVVDAKTGERLWPGDRRDDGYPVPAVELPSVDDSSANYEERLSRELAEKMADRVVKLFYKHKETPDDLPPDAAKE